MRSLWVTNLIDRCDTKYIKIKKVKEKQRYKLFGRKNSISPSKVIIVASLCEWCSLDKVPNNNQNNNNKPYSLFYSLLDTLCPTRTTPFE